MKIKKFWIIIAFLLAGKISLSDVIFIEQKRVEICAKISNLDEYPDISLFAYCDCVTLFNSQKSFKINSNSCIKLNKFCSTYIYAMSKDYIKGKDFKKVDVSKEKNALKSDVSIKSDFFLSDDPIRIVELYFKIVGFTDTSIVLYKEKQIIKYSIDKPDSIAIFKYTGDISKLKKGFVN